MMRDRLGLHLAGLFALSLGVSVPMARAATFTVDRFDDANGACDPGDCSLREAIMAAEAQPGRDLIELPAGRHLLSIPPISPGLLDAAHGSFDVVRHDVDIIGSNVAEVIIDGQGIDRVLNFAESDATLRNVTVTGGNASGTGGGITSELSQVSIQNCWIVDNHADSGGGLSVLLGTVTVTDSTISGNTAAASGGGAYVFGISFTRVGRLEVYNSTISGNQAAFTGGAIQVVAAGELLLDYTTVADNSNRPGDPSIFGFRFNLRAEAVYSLVEGACLAGVDTSCMFLLSKIEEVPVMDLGLAPLAMNGGSMPTHRLLPSSPALDLVPESSPCPPADQRGFGRPEDGNGDGVAMCDAGAYELAPSALAIPTLGTVALLAFGLLLALGGLFAIRR